MIVYGEREEIADTRALLAEIQSTTDATERLIRYGQWEAGVLDALCPETDDGREVTADTLLPERIRIRPPEGFAYYALYPENYARAAREFVNEQRPSSAVVIGIRSIGTTLSTIVAEALGCPVWRFTVRPHGHPFDRRLKLASGLEVLIRNRNKDRFVVVDEGPGLSGSSFTSVCEKLNELGVPDSNIVLFPSHAADESGFVSERAQARWRRHRKYVTEFEFPDRGARDLSGGLWRQIVPCEAAVQPQHERRKYLLEGVQWKFAGLGHFGKRRLERARALATLIPPVLDLDNGFLRSEWVDAEPAVSLDSTLLDAMARYLAFIAERFDTQKVPPVGPLRDMIFANTGLSVTAPGSGTAAEIDGRMLPHEWLRMGSGWVKADALDHYDDHFFPGCQDIAWDVAGAMVEFRMSRAACDAFVERYLRYRPDRDLRGRLPFYRTAYLAYRIGYASLAEKTLGDSEDGRRFGVLKQRYSDALRAAAR